MCAVEQVCSGVFLLCAERTERRGVCVRRDFVKVSV